MGLKIVKSLWTKTAIFSLIIFAAIIGSLGPITQSAEAAIEYEPLTGVTQVSGNCAVADGKAYCWGHNGYGQLGIGNFNNRTYAVAVDTTGVLAGKVVTKIDSNQSRTCAIADGKAYCWGNNYYGTLGNGANTDMEVPVAVDTTGALAGKTVTSISAGGCAIADGKAYCWGRSIDNNNNGNISSNVPILIDSGALAGKTVTSISAAGNGTVCAVADGKAYCWGTNLYGAVGNGTQGVSEGYTPVPAAVDTTGVLAGKTVTDIATDGMTTCAVADGRAYCWGDNYYSHGGLGNGSSVDSSTVPVAVDVSGVLAGKTVTDISANRCVIAGGAIYCWGKNTDKQDPGTYSNVPVAFGADTFADKAVTGISHENHGRIVCAIADGKAYCWGDNDFGWLGGHSSVSYSSIPVEVVVQAGEPDLPTISNVFFTDESGKKIMNIVGVDMVGATDDTEYAQAVGPPYKSFVTLNNTPLDWCVTENMLYTQEDIVSLGIPTSTDVPPCYYLLDDNLMYPVITPTTAKVWLADNFDITAPGTVSVNGSADFAFNQPSSGGNDDDTPLHPTAKVNGKSLENTPQIPNRPTFSGTATPDAKVVVTVHSDPVSCTAIADAQGKWSCTLPTNLEPGQHTVMVHVINPDNSTEDLGPYTVIVAKDGTSSTIDTTTLPDKEDPTLGAPNTGFMKQAASFAMPATLILFGSILLAGVAMIYVGARRIMKN